MLRSVKRFARGWMLVVVGLCGLVSATPTEQAADILRSVQGTFTIDFNGLPVGQRVSQVAVGEGVSGSGIGAVLLGTEGENVVRVNAQRRGREGDSNRAMTFDGECEGDPEGCSGNDDDLYNPGQGNLLIVSQDNNPDDPNDNHRGGHIDFDFSDFGPGAVTVTSLEVFDVSHNGATITLYADGERIREIPVPRGGTGERTTVEVDTPGVDFLRVTVRDSFAVDNLVFEVQ
jgi:hypothetical protein